MELNTKEDLLKVIEEQNNKIDILSEQIEKIGNQEPENEEEEPEEDKKDDKPTDEEVDELAKFFSEA